MTTPVPSPRPLFRQEVLAAQGSHFLGGIRIGRNPSFTLVAWVSLSLAAALVAFSILGEFTRKARLPGFLEPVEGTIQLRSPQAGTVMEVKVKEGDHVAEGQALITLNTDRSTQLGDTGSLIADSLQLRLSSLQTERQLAGVQALQRKEALNTRLRSSQAEIRQATDELGALARRMQMARKSVDRYESLARAGFVADIQSQQKQEELIELEIRERNAQRNLTGLKRDLNSLRAELTSVESAQQVQVAQFDRAIAALSQERVDNLLRKGTVIKAPRAGSISALSLKSGETVRADAALLTMTPSGDAQKPEQLQAVLYSPSRATGFIQPGQQVWLRYSAFPHQKFGMARGTITGISQTPIAPSDLPSGQQQAMLSATQGAEALYRITVSVTSQTILAYGEPQALKAGTMLEAGVIQDKRAIWEWMFEPLLMTFRS